MARGGFPVPLSQPVEAALALAPRPGKGAPEGRQFPGLHPGQKHHDARGASFMGATRAPAAGAFHPGHGAAHHA